MKNKVIKIKLGLYAVGHFTWRWLKTPQLLPKHLSSAHDIIKKEGKKGLIDHVFRRYLPYKYLLKTKIHIKEPSPSIHSKLRTFSSIENSLQANKNQHQIHQKVNILMIRLGAMGDVLLTTPIIKKLYEKYDGLCSISIATRYPDIFKNNPYIHQVLSSHDLRSLEKSYDLILNLDGCYEKNRSLHITQAYQYYTFGKEADHGNLQPQLFPTKQDKAVARSFIQKINSPYIVCHNRYDSSQPYRHVPAKDWETLVTKILEQSHLKIVQIGSKDIDIGLADQNARLIDARDQFNLQQTKEIIANAKLFLGIDAGPLHIAAATQTPIVAFFTIAHHEVRKPLRELENSFKAITPQVKCYGCQNKFSAGVEWKCQNEDQKFSCIFSFNLNEALDDCLSLIKS